MDQLLAVLVIGSPMAWVLYWACGFLAREKERNEWSWTIAGFILGPFAFLPLAFAPDLTEYDEAAGHREERGNHP